MGMTEIRFQEMFKQQEGACACCRKVCFYRLCVDHDHTNGQVRGLLCKKCNGLALHPHVLAEVLSYMGHHGASELLSLVSAA